MNAGAGDVFAFEFATRIRADSEGLDGMYGVPFKRVHNPREGIYFALLLLCGCASTEKDLPVPYAVTFQVAADVNRDSQNRPAPVALQTFQLKSDNNFRRADYF